MAVFFENLNRNITEEEAADNDYSTYSDLSFTLDIRNELDQGTTPDYIFIKHSGLTDFNILLDGNIIATVSNPTQITLPEGGSQSTIRRGWTHNLVPISTPTQGSSITVRAITPATDPRICEIYALKALLQLTKFNNIGHGKTDSDSIIDTDFRGGKGRRIITGEDRLRWNSIFNVDFTPGDNNYEVFLDFIEDTPNFFFAQQPNRFPWRCYFGLFPNMSHQAPYFCEVLPAGNSVTFAVNENRKVSPILNPTPTFNTTEEGSYFFKDCLHLDNERVKDSNGNIVYEASDNDYNTTTFENPLTFDITDVQGDATKVTHVWVKTRGSHQYQVQIESSGTWATQETFNNTSIQKEYRGWTHSLYKLQTPLTVEEIRLNFTGRTVEINEIMLLNFCGGIVNTTPFLPAKTDRSGLIHDGSTGDIERVKLAGAERFKWSLDFQAVFGHLNTMDFEDFLDWIDENPTFVFAEDPIQYPWRIYPATFLQNAYKSIYLTRYVQMGSKVQMQVVER